MAFAFLPISSARPGSERMVFAVAVFFLARKVYCELPMEKPRELDHFGRVIKRK